jgi:hypothetical protein
VKNFFWSNFQSVNVSSPLARSPAHRPRLPLPRLVPRKNPRTPSTTAPSPPRLRRKTHRIRARLLHLPLRLAAPPPARLLPIAKRHPLETPHTTEKGPPSPVHQRLGLTAAESAISVLSTAAAIFGPPATGIRRRRPWSSLPTQSSIHPCLGSATRRRTLKPQQPPNAEAITSRVSASLPAPRHFAEGQIKMHTPILESHQTIVVVTAVAG